MNSRQQQLCVALGAACLLAGCGQAGSGAQGQGGTGAAAQGAAAAAAPKPCPTKWLTVRSSDDEHLEQTQRVRFKKNNGDYTLRLMLNPVDKEKHWLDKDFTAQEDDDTGTLFYASVEVQDTLHDVVDTHTYKITMELQDGCVRRARFHTDLHPSVDGPDHGGDAVLD